MTSTYKTMDISDLGDNATVQELNAFRKACEQRQADTDETDEQVTAWMWADGNWLAAVEDVLGIRAFDPARTCVLCGQPMGDDAGDNHARCEDAEALLADLDPR